jgi:hypothetical protein
MNESFEKMDFTVLPEQMAKTAWKRGHIGNSQEKEMAPISFGNWNEPSAGVSRNVCQCIC